MLNEFMEYASTWLLFFRMQLLGLELFQAVVLCGSADEKTIISAQVVREKKSRERMEAASA